MSKPRLRPVFFDALPSVFGPVREKNEAPHEGDEPANEHFFRNLYASTRKVTLDSGADDRAVHMGKALK